MNLKACTCIYAANTRQLKSQAMSLELLKKKFFLWEKKSSSNTKLLADSLAARESADY